MFANVAQKHQQTGRPEPVEVVDNLSRRGPLKVEETTQLGTDSVEPETVGWVSYNNFLETAPQLDELLLGRYLRLGLRVDSKVVPSGLVQAHMDLEMKALRQAGDGARLSKREVDEIKEGVVESLKPQIQAKTQFLRGIWSMKDKTLYLLTVSESASERFSKQFQKTFERKLVSLEPLGMVRHLGLSSELSGKLAVLEPADFRPGGGRL